VGSFLGRGVKTTFYVRSVTVLLKNSPEKSGWRRATLVTGITSGPFDRTIAIHNEK